MTLKNMKKISSILAFLAVCLAAHAEDGSRLWLSYDSVGTCQVELRAQPSPTTAIAVRELHDFCKQPRMTLIVDKSLAEELKTDGFIVSNDTLKAATDQGLLYGAYDLLRSQQSRPGERSYREVPCFPLRLLNHWDNLDGSIERGYAGQSIFDFDRVATGKRPLDTKRLTQYARANASIGINGSVLNNVNASPAILTAPYLKTVKRIADILRPYGIKVYLSINFASPMAIGGLKTADPLDENVKKWWKKKVREIYQSVPDFGGFLVKANSEGQPGPGDFGRTHADGANMLAEALEPHGGIVMWRCFVYGANHKGEDRVKQAVSEFKPLDGQFRPNVILQTKNGPLDFQPREPYSPIFDQIKETPNMAELQITQEYTGQSKHLVFLAPMWEEFFNSIAPSLLRESPGSSRAIPEDPPLQGVAGVANIGDDTNWCGHHFSQGNWYAFGRMAWGGRSSQEIAQEWLKQTFGGDEAFCEAMGQVMARSREACVDYMMPLGLHHIFRFDHHYGPEPGGFKAEYPIEWCPVYYHKADSAGIGFDRTVATGTGATVQYRPQYFKKYEDLRTCPENLLLWFHHVPWSHRMRSGLTLWQEMQEKYEEGVREVERTVKIWRNMRPGIDAQRWQEVADRLDIQLRDAREWRDVCLAYFGQFANRQSKQAE